MNKWAIFISGRGSNLQNWLDHLEYLDLRLVVSNRNQALGLRKAKRFGIPTFIFTKDLSWDYLFEVLKNHKVNAIMLCGFMKLIPESFLSMWKGTILNIHPSLLPLYPGKDAFERAILAGGPFGVTIHHVIPEMDAGIRVIQKTFSRNHFEILTSQQELTIQEIKLTREVIFKWI